jgi:nitrite reductase/ring-hydroxylating ferredoxin subunit
MARILPAGTAFVPMAQLPDGASHGFDLNDDEWPMRGFVVRIGDDVHAYANRCPHAGRQLNFLANQFLTPDGGLIRCCAHGALFEKASGLCVAGPCVDEHLRRLAVRIENETVCLAEDLDLDALARGPW